MSVTTEQTKPIGRAKDDEPRLVDDRQKDVAVPPLAIAILAAAVALTAMVYWGAFSWWLGEWTTEGSFYAHGIFIPFFVAIMIWRDKERLRRLPVERSWGGLGIVVTALVIVLISMRTGVTVPLSISFVLYLIGVVLLVAGKRFTRAILFPILFLSTMIPLVPDQLINPIAFPIQVLSAKMAAALSSAVGFSASVENTTVHLTSYTMDVELPCSGFKTLLGLLSFSAAFAYIVEGQAWKRWALFAMSGPLAIVVNGLRITLIGIVGEVRGKEAAQSFHDYSGFIVLILAFTFLFNMARLLNCQRFLGIPLVDPPETAKSPKPEATDAGSDQTVETKESRRDREEASALAEQAAADEKWGPARRIPFAEMARGVVPLIALLGLTVVAQAAMRKPVRDIPAIGSADVPVMLNAERGKWQAQLVGGSADIPIADRVREALKPISFVNRVYDGEAGRSGNIEMLMISGTSRKVFHDPHTCLVTTGEMMRDIHRETIDTPAGPLRVMLSEADNPKFGTKYMMMVCYLIDGKQYQTTQASNAAIVWQQLLGDHGRASYFLRFRQMTPGTDPARVEELKSFVTALWGDIGPKIDALVRRTQADSK